MTVVARKKRAGAPGRRAAVPGRRAGAPRRRAVHPAWQGRPGPGLRLAKAVALAVVVLLVLFPVWTVVATSLAEPGEVVANGGWVVWPDGITFGAYAEILDGGIVTRSCGST